MAIIHDLKREPKEKRGKSEPAKTVLRLQEQALYGFAGDVVNTILPYTEAHQAALLVHVLAFFGNIIGHNAHFRVERTAHHLNIFAVIVGATSRSRKGTSASTPRHIFQRVDPLWHSSRVKSGLSSGQGLIWAVRDKVVESRQNKDGEYEDHVVDEGEDKRLLVLEEEFSQALKLMPTDANILSAVIREAWETGNLSTLTTGRKIKPVTATDAHISIIGHITREELLRLITETDQANGFANRFLWLVVERSKLIPNPKGAPDEVLQPLIEQLQNARDFAMRAGELERDKSAEEIWSACYPKLTDDLPGMIGGITSRAAPQVMRLACLHALMNFSTMIRPQHLNAALALWDYCFQSARSIFGDSLGDPVADRILSAVSGSTAGLSATEIAALFNNHKSKDIDRALALLLELNLIEETIFTETKGRPRTVYTAKGDSS